MSLLLKLCNVLRFIKDSILMNMKVYHISKKVYHISKKVYNISLGHR